MLGRFLAWMVGLASRSPWLTVLVHAILLLAAVMFAWRSFQDDPRVQGGQGIGPAIFDNDLAQVWGEVPEVQEYEAFKQRFGSDEVVVLAIHGPGELDPAALSQAARVAKALEEAPEKFQVLWLADLPYAPESLVFGDTPGPEEIASFRALLARDPSSPRLVRLGDGWDLALIVGFPPGEIDDVRRLELAERVRRLYAGTEPPEGWSAAVMGSPVLLGELRAASLSTLERVLPLVNLLVVAICLVVFRRPRVVAVALGTLLQGELLALGLFFATGHRFNYVSSYLVTCVVVVGFATNMHLYARYCHERKARTVSDAIREAAVVVARPATVSVGTSCLAFLSLVTARQAAISQFGLFSAIGMVLVLLAAYSLGPALLVLLDQKDRPEHHRPLLVPDPTALALRCWRRPWPVLAGATLALILGFVGMDRLLVGSDVRESFPPSHPATRDLGFVVERFPGISAFELVVRWPPDQGPASGSALLASTDHLERALVAGLPPVNGRAVTDADVGCASDLGRGWCLAEHRAPLCEGGLPKMETADALFQEPELLPPVFRFDPAGTEARCTLFVDLPNARDGVALADRIEAIAAEAAGPGTTAEVTGLAPLWSRLEATIVDDLGQSFLQGAAVLLAMIVLSVRGLRAFLIVLFLYAFPLAVVTGVAGFLSRATGYHVNSAVMMYVTVAEGIVVDDVVYFVLGFLHHRKIERTATRAMSAAVREVGDGVVLTAICLSAGFLLMLLGDITNAQLMGGLTASAVLVALVGVVCVLPALARLLLCPRGEDVEAEFAVLRVEAKAEPAL